MRDNMEDLNKISSTRVGDNIHFYVNGQEDKGVVVKMDTGYVTVLKDNGDFQDIHINETFFIKDILVNKTWNDMNLEERTVKLVEIKAYSPRFVGKSWQELPPELKAVLEKGASGALPSGKEKLTEDNPNDTKEGQATNARVKEPPKAGRHRADFKKLQNATIENRVYEEPNKSPSRLVNQSNVENSNKTDFGSDLPDRSHEKELVADANTKYMDHNGNPHKTQAEADAVPPRKHVNRRKLREQRERYNSNTNMTIGQRTNVNQSNVEDGAYGNAGNVPLAGVNTNQEEDAEDDYEGQTHDTKTEQFKHEEVKPTTKTMQEQLWEDWLNKETMSGGDSSPAQTAITTGTTGVYNSVYSKNGRHGGQSKDKEEEETEKDKEEKEKERKG